MNKFLMLIKKHPALSWVLGFQLFRFFLLPFMGLMPQDAYYYMYGQNLSLSYFDHPGMIGYLLRIFTNIFGPSVFTIKFADFSITSLTIFCFYKLASFFLSQQKLWRSTVLLVSTIFISILSFNSTPDVPLLLFWTLSILCLYKAVFDRKKWFWVLGGIVMGLAFDSKYTALLLPFGLLVFLIFSNSYRKLLLSPWLYICLIISAIMTFPVWWWNYQNEFVSFAFQSSVRTDSISRFRIKPKLFFGAVGHQLFLLLPVLFSVFIIFSYKHVKKAITKFKLPSQKTLFLLAFFIPTFFGFFLITPIYWVKLNWMMPSYITGIIIAGMYISKKLIKAQMIISIIFHLALAGQVIFFFVPIKSDDTWVGWRELSVEIKKLQNKYHQPFLFSMDGYKTSAVLRFYLNQKVYAQNIAGIEALHFDYMDDDLKVLEGKNALFIDSDKRFKNKLQNGTINPDIRKHFASIQELTPIIVNEGTAKARKFWVFYCTNYQPEK
ncbi:MAG: hypothetical protein GKR88_05895 [Flavobacteriaceae bacterium]|nr:MAG: hypothetical protein GKR88_05895 [Flavobacteriaceae bacterium]